MSRFPVRTRYVQPRAEPEQLSLGKGSRQNKSALSKAARRARLVQRLRDHIRTAHAGQRVAPLNLGTILYDEQDAPLLCDLCGETFTSPAEGKRLI